ncbi:MAG: MarR family winged helix-turn-helix transcriptional regulator [Cyanobacteria bacterium J06649_4]
MGDMVDVDFELKSQLEQIAVVQQSCMCLHLQKAARTAARRFDEAFRPLGITSGQYSLLIALACRHPPSIGVLAKDMAMDRTTITANIKPLRRRGLIELVPDPKDARSRLVLLTTPGRALLKEAIPLWRTAQETTVEALSKEEVEQFRRGLKAVAG